MTPENLTAVRILIENVWEGRSAFIQSSQVMQKPLVGSSQRQGPGGNPTRAKTKAELDLTTEGKTEERHPRQKNVQTLNLETLG